MQEPPDAAASRTLRARSIEEKVASLVPDTGDVRSELWTLVGVADASLDTAMFSARRIVELIVGRVLQREEIPPDRDLMKNIEALGARDGKEAQRRKKPGDAALPPPCLPPPLYSALHSLRIYGNLVAHPWEPDRPEQKDVRITSTDLQVALAQILRLVEWFFQEYPRGPKVDPLYSGGGASALAAFGDAPPAAAALFGRDVETRFLTGALAKPEARLLTIVGPGGTGKTAVASRVAEDHARRSPSPLLLAWFDLGASPSFADVSARLLASLEPDARPGDVSIASLPPMARVGQILRRLAERPTLLVFDSLEEWLDPATREARDPAFGRLLAEFPARAHAARILCTTRIEPVVRGAPSGTRESHALRPLDEEAVTHLLRSEGLQGTDGELRDLGRSLGGNARLARLVAETLVRRRLPRVVDAARRIPALVGGAADSVIGEALRDLSPTARRVLEALAVTDAPLERATLVRACAVDASVEDDVEAALWDELAPRSLISSSAEGDEIRVEHPLLSDALRARCVDPADVHRRLAVALAAALAAGEGGRSATALALRRARHLLAAGDAQGAAGVLTAGDLRQSIDREGAHALFLEAARPLLAHRTSLADPVRVDLLRRIVRSQGQLGEGEDTADLLDEAAAICERLKDSDRTFRVELARARHARWTRRWDSASQAIERARALAQSSGDDGWTARVLVTESALAHVMGHFAEANHRAAAALELADKVGEPRMRVEARIRLATSFTGGGNLSRPRRLYEEALKIGRETDDLASQARISERLADIARRQTRHAEALSLADFALEHARRVGDRAAEARARHGRALAMAGRGSAHLSAARDELRIALRLAFDLRHRKNLAVFLESMSGVLAALRKPGAALAAHRAAVAVFGATGRVPRKIRDRDLGALRQHAGDEAWRALEARPLEQSLDLLEEASGIEAARWKPALVELAAGGTVRGDPGDEGGAPALPIE